MKILTWNLDFWKKMVFSNLENKETWKNHAKEIIKSDYDFICLQEINPYYLFQIDYDNKDGPIDEFNIWGKNVHYHELYSVLKKEVQKKNIVYWGTSIIAKNKYRLVKKHFYSNGNYIGSEYYGHETLMCYNFETDDNRKITIINYYKKGIPEETNYDLKFAYEESFFKNIQEVFEEVNNNNIIIFAGDFNAGIDVRKKIMNIGFIDKTIGIANTMVELPNVMPFPNDRIFVNEKYTKAIDASTVKKVSLGMNSEELYTSVSDHFGIECFINL